jgi:hypothetical protein
MDEHNALIATRRGRPAVLEKDGCRVYIAVHDEFYRRRKAEFKNRLKLVHPDMMPVQRIAVKPVPVETVAVKSFQAPRSKRCRPYWRSAHTRKAHTRKAYTLRVPNNGSEFRRINAAYERWLAEEAAWYAAHGLTPPEWSGGKE